MRYWEDLKDGEKQQYSPILLTQAIVADYRARFATPVIMADPPIDIPCHLLCCLCMRLIVEHGLKDTAAMGSPGVDYIEWPGSVQLGDELTLHDEILSTRELNSRSDMGLARKQMKLCNQNDEVVMLMISNILVGRRHGGEA